VIADRWPERLASLTMLWRPHPAAFARAMKTDPEQPQRSRHHHELLDTAAGPRLMLETASGRVFPSIKGGMRVLLGFREFAEGKLEALDLDFAH
jgi:hypothetical protein